MKKILLLTAGFGEGHNAAARNVAAAIEELEGRGSAEIVDLFAEASPRLNRLSRAGYLTMINRTPKLWNAFYAWVDKSRFFPRHLWFVRKETAVLARRLAAEKPDALCSTYPVYGFIAEHLRQKGLLRCPYFSVVTDSISINTLWTRPQSSGLFVPNPDTGEAVAAQGVPRELIYDYGFPVQLDFLRHGQELSPPKLALGARPRVLYMIHSGVRHAEETAKRLLSKYAWDLTLAVGRDNALRQRLLKAAEMRPERSPVTILSWTDQIPRLLMTHNVVISKAGGATTQEAIAARCPMIVNQIVPGQEEGNYELLKRRAIGARAETPDAVIAALEQAFAEQGKLWSTWRSALETLARPDAAQRIARHVLSGTGSFAAVKAAKAPAAPQEHKGANA